MARKKNVKRIDPRYFMDEKTDVPLNEAATFSPLSSTKPGERIAPPGSQRPRDDQARLVAGSFEGINNAMGILELSYEGLVEQMGSSFVRSSGFGRLKDGLDQLKFFVKELKELTGPGGNVPHQRTVADQAAIKAF